MPSYYDQINNSGPKVWYRFNETAGTPVNSGSLSTTSTFIDLLLNEQTDVDGRAVYLNGSNSYIELPAHSQFALFNDRSFTVECWVKIANADTNRTLPLEIFRLNAPSSPHYIVSLVVDGTAGTRGKVRLGSTWTTDILSTNAIDDGTWHHIVYTYNTSSVKLYIDGTLNSSTTPTNLIASFNFDQSTKKLIGAGYVGIGQSSISQYFKGRIDEFAAYDYELTSTNILANFNAGASVEIAAGSFGTATSLMVQPTTSASFNPAAQAPMTASAASGDHYNSTVTFPTLLDNYMSTLTLEFWHKFNSIGFVENFGTGLQSAFANPGQPLNNVVGGIQGTGSYAFETDDKLAAISTTGTGAGTSYYATALNDENFTIGFWTKKLTPELIKFVNGYVVSNQSTGDRVTFSYNANGGITFLIRANNTDHSVASTTDITDGQYHFVAGRLASNTMELFIDGVSIGTTTMNHGITLDRFDFQGTGTSDAISVSQFFLSTSASVTSTEITNIYNAGIPTFLQASAYFPEPRLSFASAFNNYIESKSPIGAFRMDEAAALPQNYGSAVIVMQSLVDPVGYTQNEISLNNTGFNFTKPNQGLAGFYALSAGTLSTNNVATFGVLFKLDNKTETHDLGGFGGVNTVASSGNGIQLQILTSTGYIRVLSGNGNSTTTNFDGNVDYADSNWHLAIAVQEASSLKVYVDGKLHINQTRSTTFTDNGAIGIGRRPIFGNSSTTSINKRIDEVFALSTALTAQEAFEAYRALRLEMGTTATALAVEPSLILGTGNIYTAAPATASGLVVMPTETQEIAPTIEHMEAFGVFQYPNFGGNVVIDVNYGTTAFAADAEFHIPGFSIGEINSVVHMQGSGLMVHPISIAGGSISVNPGIALDATLVMPGIVTIKGALVNAQTLNANAFAPLPPAYFTIADDLWYQRLVAIDQKDSVGNSSIVFFNTSDNFYVGSDPAPGSGWAVPYAVGITATNAVTNPLPAINGGYFDAQNRKAVNFRNISLTTGNPSPIGVGDKDFTFEVMIKTTKSNQVLFIGENDNSNNFQRTGIILRDGKLALTYSKDRRAGTVSANDSVLAFIGNKNIADGQWHHLIIQNRQTGVDSSGARLQFWIDGQLDIQRYGNEMYVINIIGYNSSELNSYSDFTISAFGLGLSAMVEENEINLNYLAAINVVPVKAGVATATATATPNTKGRGNRGRALMLYFWPTFNYASGFYKPLGSAGIRGTSSGGNNVHNYDQAGYGANPDTFYQLTTYLNQGANKFYDWDVWPVPVTQFYSGDQWVGESHPILKDGITKDGTDKGTVYVDSLTDNERYLNLMTDFKDLDQFDMICFRNYPDQSYEQDIFGVNAKGVVDDYFNLLDKNLFTDFLKSLREAVDTGISLLITNPQLAVDMGFIDTYHEVSDLTNSGMVGDTDEFSPIKLDDPYEDGSEIYTYSNTYPGEGDDAFLDAYRNNYHEVLNTLTDLTDDDGFVWTDEIKYVADQSEFGELDRWWSHIEYKDSLQVGDRFLISTTPTYSQTYFATPLYAVRAGKVITKFADTYRYGAVERVNPYRNYATSIAVEPGTVVAGKQIGAKVFISFTDVVGVQQLGNAIGGQGLSIEHKSVSLNTSYWISYAYSIGAITTDQRNEYLSDIENGQIVDWKTLTSTDTRYWTSDGIDIIGSSSPYGDNNEVSTDTSEAVKNKKTSPRTRRSKGRAKKVGNTGLIPNFSIVWGYIYPRLSVPVPSINTRALWWLSERLEYADGVPLRPEAFESDAFMPQPVITGFKTATVPAQPGLAVGAMIETNLRSAGTSIAVLPLTATALFVERGTFVPAAPATASSTLAQDIRTTTFESDQVVLYLVHVDPILYLREDVIK